MRLISGIAGAALMALLSFLIMGPATANLDGSLHIEALVVATLWAGLVGWLVASAIVRRARSRLPHMTLFGLVAGALGGGLVGAVWLAGLLAVYFVSYSAWPPDLTDRILTVLSFPALAALGFSTGAFIGGLGGLLTGGLLRVVLPARW